MKRFLQLKWMLWFRCFTFSFIFLLYSFLNTHIFQFQQLFLSFFITLCGPTPSFTKPFSQQVSSHRNHPLVHQLRDEDSQSRVVFQPEEGIDEKIEAEFPIRHASHNRTARDANSPCFHYIEARTWDSCRQKYVDKVHCHSTHAACYRALAQGYSYPACQVVFGYPQAKYISKCAALPIDCQCAAWIDSTINHGYFCIDG